MVAPDGLPQNKTGAESSAPTPSEEAPMEKDLSGTWLISDLHLCADKPYIYTAAWRFFSDLADHVTKKPGSIPALYLLGDLFEVWVGDDDKNSMALEFSAHCAHLARLGVQLYIQHGNRDFLIGKSFASQCQATLLPETHIAKINGETTLLLHGDELCTDDLEYQRLRLQLRSSHWQNSFLAQNLTLRKIQAQQYRDASKTAQADKSEAIMDVNEGTTMHIMMTHGVTRLIHGHTHRPQIHRYACTESAPFRFRCVLGDWDQYAYGICIQNQQAMLKRWPISDSVHNAEDVDHQPWRHLNARAQNPSSVTTDA